MDTSLNSIQGSWKDVLKELILSENFLRLNEFVANEQKTHLVCPPKDKIFAAFNHTAFENVKVVIIGQDPYHKKGQANGLAFSVSPRVAIPPSLKNIFKELKSDLNIPIPKNGNLEPWADQGVLLLNATLTVREGVAGSHQKKGWEFFTDEVIKIISEQKSGIVFLLWGNFAQSKEKIINQDKHVILKAAHPSPLARGAFFGCKHFSKTNEILIKQGLTPIDWSLEMEEMTLF